jgi:hypothetical protein
VGRPEVGTRSRHGAATWLQSTVAKVDSLAAELDSSTLELDFTPPSCRWPLLPRAPRVGCCCRQGFTSGRGWIGEGQTWATAAGAARSHPFLAPPLLRKPQGAAAF